MLAGSVHSTGVLGVRVVLVVVVVFVVRGIISGKISITSTSGAGSTHMLGRIDTVGGKTSIDGWYC